MKNETEKLPTNIVASVKRDDLKNIFRIVTAKQNTLSEIFPQPILVGVEDIQELFTRISTKLSHHDVISGVFAAVVTFESNKSQEFGSWDFFRKADWKSAEVTQTVLLKWQFLIQFHNAEKPEAHTISVRLTNSPNPFHYLQAIFSRDPEDIEKVETDSAPMICRVDFADQGFSQEILALIGNWNKARKTPQLVFPVMKHVKRNMNLVRDLIKYSLPIVAAATCLGFYIENHTRFDPTNTASIGYIYSTVMWLAVSMFVIVVSSLFARWLASFAYFHIARFGRFTVFELTNGDANKQTQLHARSNNSVAKFIIASLIALAWNIIGGVFTTLLMQ